MRHSIEMYPLVAKHFPRARVIPQWHSILLNSYYEYCQSVYDFCDKIDASLTHLWIKLILPYSITKHHYSSNYARCKLIPEIDFLQVDWEVSLGSPRNLLLWVPGSVIDSTTIERFDEVTSSWVKTVQ